MPPIFIQDLNGNSTYYDISQAFKIGIEHPPTPKGVKERWNVVASFPIPCGEFSGGSDEEEHSEQGEWSMSGELYPTDIVLGVFYSEDIAKIALNNVLIMAKGLPAGN